MRPAMRVQLYVLLAKNLFLLFRQWREPRDSCRGHWDMKTT